MADQRAKLETAEQGEMSLRIVLQHTTERANTVAQNAIAVNMDGQTNIAGTAARDFAHTRIQRPIAKSVRTIAALRLGAGDITRSSPGDNHYKCTTKGSIQENVGN